MTYMLLIHYDHDEAERTSADARRETYAAYDQFNALLRERGIEWSANPLHDPATGTVVRVRGGTKRFTDGPFAETREQLGGYYLVDVDSRDTALELAALLPAAAYGAVEVREVFDIGQDPKLKEETHGD